MAVTLQASIARSAETAKTPATPASPAPRRLLATEGAPLQPSVRIPLERAFGRPLDDVRVQAGGETAALAETMGARAFTYGSTIHLGRGESPSDLPLMAHEAAHVLQQRGGGARVQTLAGHNSDAHEREANLAASAAMSGRSFAIQGRTGAPTVQREDKKPWWRQGLDWAEDVISGAVQFSEDIGWRLAEQFVPELVPFLRKGPAGLMDWLKDRLSAGLESVFNTFMAPVRNAAGMASQLSKQFAPLVGWARDAAEKISHGDCTPLREAAKLLEDVAQALIQPIVEKVQPIIATIEGFFKKVWESVGSPVWEWIKKIAAQQWALIEQLAGWVWDKAEPIRKAISSAWTWFKNKLGIGEGPEGQNGILQWLQAKAGEAWTWLKAKLAPFQNELILAAKVIGGILLLLPPAGPIVLIGGAIAGLIVAVRWIKANWGKGDALVKARTYVEKQLIPMLLGHVHRLTGAMTGFSRSFAASLASLAAGMNRMVGALAGSLLAFAVSAVEWIAGQINALAEWGAQKLVAAVDLLGAGLTRLSAFMQRVLDFLGKVANVVIDVWALPVKLLGKVWNAIPACIRDPFIDFIMPIILRQIELFRELVKDDKAWQRTKKEIQNILRLVFDNRDLTGAVKAAFLLVLRVFNMPPELLVQLWQKAEAAWDIVSAKPIQFIKNLVRSIGRGFGLLWANIRTHLAYGLEGWLFGAVADKGIQPPSSWTDLKAVFYFVLDVMGLSMDHVFELLAKRFDPIAIGKIQKYYHQITGAIDWIRNAIDTSKSPAENTKGLIEKGKDFGATVVTRLVEWIAGRVAIELGEMAAAAAASAGLSEILDIARRIYRALLTAKRWAAQIVEMVGRVLDSVLEIATGAIDAAGKRLEGVLHKGMPVVIGFLADQVGLGGVADEIRDLVDELRAKVDDAILWLIDKLKAMLDAIVAAVRDLAGAVLAWWRKKFGFTSDDGAPHSILVEGSADSPEIYVQSTRTGLDDLIDKIKDADLKKKARATGKEIVEVIEAGKQAKSEKEMNDQATKLETKLGALSTILKAAKVLDKVVLPAPTYSFGPKSGGSRIAEVKNLSANRPWGSPPKGGSQEPDGWSFVQTTGQTTGPPYFRQMHLINERFGGPGIKDNLAPGPQSANSEHLKKAEDRIKELVGKEPNQRGFDSVVLSYQVTAEYYASSEKLAADARVSDFAERFICTWTAIDGWPDDGKAKKTTDGYTVTNFQPPRKS